MAPKNAATISGLKPGAGAGPGTGAPGPGDGAGAGVGAGWSCCANERQAMPGACR